MLSNERRIGTHDAACSSAAASPALGIARAPCLNLQTQPPKIHRLLYPVNVSSPAQPAQGRDSPRECQPLNKETTNNTHPLAATLLKDRRQLLPRKILANKSPRQHVDFGHPDELGRFGKSAKKSHSTYRRYTVLIQRCAPPKVRAGATTRQFCELANAV